VNWVIQTGFQLLRVLTWCKDESLAVVTIGGGIFEVAPREQNENLSALIEAQEVLETRNYLAYRCPFQKKNTIIDFPLILSEGNTQAKLREILLEYSTD
jgi:hypothetical protein